MLGLKVFDYMPVEMLVGEKLETFCWNAGTG